MSHLPPLPASLKPIQHYLKTANEHDKRDPVVSYYCQLYAMQNGMEIDKKSKEARTFLFALMDYLEKFKTEHSENDAITSEVVGQAHMENYALKVFLFADNEDRAGRFNKNVVKSFYTAGMLFDVLGCFGEISEDDCDCEQQLNNSGHCVPSSQSTSFHFSKIQKNRKYAKWKAAYIHKCLKNGETPVPGPLGGEDGEEGLSPADNLQPGPSYPANNLPTPSNQQPQVGAFAPPTTPQDPPQIPQQPSPSQSYVPQQPAPSQSYHQPQPAAAASWTPPQNAKSVRLTAEQYQKAMKLCKYAGSALQYEDSETAVTNLTKALKLLTTGKET
ncbi:vacuolar protein sorting-associated protein VTA1 homolog isoform X1 [Mytilus galloprovincialis]|uniref:vacuolar protein sorting-associated protein VTA1 homolog isoform X1 n=1 Tax=Mytilus galloprovincialis TaxID=29158 RepID=UPI003F7CC128